MSHKNLKTILILSLIATLSACGGDNNVSSMPPASPEPPLHPPVAPPPQEDSSPIANMVKFTKMQAASEFALKQHMPEFSDPVYPIKNITTTIDAFFPDEDTQVEEYINSLTNQGFAPDNTYRGPGQRLKKTAAGDTLTVHWEPVATAAYQMIEYKLSSKSAPIADNIQSLLPELLVNPKVGVAREYKIFYERSAFDITDNGNPKIHKDVEVYLDDIDANHGFDCGNESGLPVCQKIENDGTKVTSVRNLLRHIVSILYVVDEISKELLATTFVPNDKIPISVASAINENGTVEISHEHLLRVLLPENDGLIDDVKLPNFVENSFQLISTAPVGDMSFKALFEGVAKSTDFQLSWSDEEYTEYENQVNYLSVGHEKEPFIQDYASPQEPLLDKINSYGENLTDLQSVTGTLTLNTNHYQLYISRVYPAEARAAFEQYRQALENAGYQDQAIQDGVELYKKDFAQGIDNRITISDCEEGVCVYFALCSFQPGVVRALMRRHFRFGH